MYQESFIDANMNGSLNKSAKSSADASPSKPKSLFIDVPTISRFVDKSYTVVIKNILIFDNLKSEENFLEFEKDLKEELCSYGNLEKLYVPRPPHLSE